MLPDMPRFLLPGSIVFCDVFPEVNLYQGDASFSIQIQRDEIVENALTKDFLYFCSILIEGLTNFEVYSHYDSAGIL